MFKFAGHKRLAFTLAEVLITIGVIGVVAALTVPTLTSNYKRTTIEARLKKTFSVASSACLRMRENEEAPYVKDTELYYWSIVYGSTGSVVPAARLSNVDSIVKKYFNTIKETTSSDMGYAIYLPDGTILHETKYSYTDNGANAGGFMFIAQMDPKNPKYTYAFALDRNCSFLRTEVNDQAKAFNAVVDNDWKIPD